MLEDYWYIVCRSKELDKKPLGRQLFGSQLVLFRDESGIVIALEDRCRHRNAPLSEGHVCDGTIQCPYHGWQYDKEGNITHVPAKPVLLLNAELKGVKKYQCAEQQGYIWVCIGNPGTNTPQRFPHLGASGWSSFQMKTRFESTVEACLENFLDCPHATYVHKSWFRSPTERKIKTIVRMLDDGAVAEYFEEPREKSVVWSLLSPSKSEMRHTDRFIAPATSRVDYIFSNGMHYSITSSCTPVQEGVTDVVTVISYKIKWFGSLVWIYFKPLSKLIINQDVEILKSQARNITKHGGPDFVVLETDLLLNAIRLWRTAITNNEPPPAAGREKHIELNI